MGRETKSNRQAIAFAVIASIVICGASASTFAQSTAHDNRLAFGQFFTSHTNQNLRLENVLNRNTKPETLFGTEAVLLEDELPTPDFSAMSEWYEIRKWEFDLYSRLGAVMHLTIVAKKESRPKVWRMVSKDEDGVTVSPLGEVLICGSTIIMPMVVNEPYKCSFAVPEKKVLKTVKTMRAVQQE